MAALALTAGACQDSERETPDRAERPASSAPAEAAAPAAPPPSEGQVEVRAGAAANLTGAVTAVALIRPEALGVGDVLALHAENGDAVGYRVALDAEGQLVVSDGRSARRAPRDLTADTEWALVAVGKSPGRAPAHFHLYGFDGEGWRHARSRGSLGDGAAVPGGTVRLAAGADRSAGGFAAAALFDFELTDAQLEGLVGSYEDWLGLDPVGMWILNQTDLTHPLLDETGGGADEVGAGTVEKASVGDAAPIGGDPNATIFRADFRTGDVSQWWDEQEVGPGASVSVPKPVSPPPGETRYARFELTGGDERAEVYSGLRLYEGEDVYVRFLVRFVAPFPAETADVWGQLAWQLHQRGEGSPPVALYITGARRRLSLGGRDGDWWLGPPIEEGKWYELVVRVRHSQDPKRGFVEVWLDGKPQLLPGSRYRRHGATLLDEYNYPKSGYYRDTGMMSQAAIEVAGYRIVRNAPDAVAGGSETR
jgi:hypothetical protein